MKAVHESGRARRRQRPLHSYLRQGSLIASGGRRSISGCEAARRHAVCQRARAADRQVRIQRERELSRDHGQRRSGRSARRRHSRRSRQWPASRRLGPAPRRREPRRWAICSTSSANKSKAYLATKKKCGAKPKSAGLSVCLKSLGLGARCDATVGQMFGSLGGVRLSLRRRKRRRQRTTTASRRRGSADPAGRMRVRVDLTTTGRHRGRQLTRRDVRGGSQGADRLLLRLSDGVARPDAEQRHDAGPEGDERHPRAVRALRVQVPAFRADVSAGHADAAARRAAGKPMAARSYALGYNDVLDAWKHYLKNDNNGRGVVLIGHSQGPACSLS